MEFRSLFRESRVNTGEIFVVCWKKIVCFLEIELHVVIAKLVVNEFLFLMPEDCPREHVGKIATNLVSRIAEIENHCFPSVQKGQYVHLEIARIWSVVIFISP